MKYHYPLLTRIKIQYYKLFCREDKFWGYIRSLWYHDLNKYGAEIIEKINRQTNSKGINYWLTWGSLLGYYREHGFIYGDNDIDIGMFYKDITLDFINGLINNGFEFVEAILDKDYKDIQLAFNYKNVKVDVYSFHYNTVKDEIVGFAPEPLAGDWKESKRQNKYKIKVVRFPYKGFKTVAFIGVKTNVVVNEEEILKILYGDKFMTPIPGFKAKINDYITIKDVATCYAMRYNYKELENLYNAGLM